MESLPAIFPRDALEAFCRRYEVRELSVFGSMANGSARADSDVDVLVEFSSTARPGFLTLARMQRELSELARRKVDLVPKAGLKPLIRDVVLSSARVLYAA